MKGREFMPTRGWPEAPSSTVPLSIFGPPCKCRVVQVSVLTFDTDGRRLRWNAAASEAMLTDKGNLMVTNRRAATRRA